MIDLYYAPTPNGWKISIMLEECDLDYKVVPVNLGKGDQFKPDFLKISPNNRMPVIVDHTNIKEGEPLSIFESGAILIYLAEKFQSFIPTDLSSRAECLSWLMWQMGSAPYLGGGFGHFYAYAPKKWQYPIDRYAMEVKRQLDVLDKNLSERSYLCGDEYNIADIASYAWYGALVLHNIYEASEFLEVSSYKNVVRWAREIEQRPAVMRGRRVNKTWGPKELRLKERHSAGDFD